MAIMTAAEAAALSEGRLTGDPQAEIDGFTVDSRKAVPGSMFVALKGENTDGNKYLESAIDNGASCVLSTREPERGTAIVVEDTLAALQKMAARFLLRTSPKVYAVTGSVGKTTTKQFVYSVISHGFRTQKTEGNYNSIIGLPLTVLETKPDTEALVLEMGMSGLHEIEVMSLIARPSVGIITNIGTSHMEILGSRENILRAKLEITAGMAPGSTLILNGDDRMLWGVRDMLREKYEVLYYAFINQEADYRILDPSFPNGTLCFDLKRPDGTVCRGITAPTIGMHNVYNAAAAYICGRISGMSDEQIKQGTASFENTGMRQKVYKKGGFTILCDCYNAAPESMKASMSTLMMLAADTGGKAHALLGQMMELGDDSVKLHRGVGAAAAELGVDYLYTYGEAAKEYASGALIEGMDEDRIVCIDDGEPFETAAKAIAGKAKEGDVIMFKASRSVGLEGAVEAFEKIVTENENEN
ncbi:MAG: UDP-N-acetylmuramoyl-tripeptide--D-alanyl-D-alanine ligase [Clostridia bacterium]|nr:UDP-N-acetylmuramoyl-tripeptide--D-alanyl-D-alanine ligase [Clostridia bacterium]